MPVIRLEKRTHTSRAALLLAPVGAIAFTLLVSALLVLWAGAPVGRTYAALLQGGFGAAVLTEDRIDGTVEEILRFDPALQPM